MSGQQITCSTCPRGAVPSRLRRRPSGGHAGHMADPAQLSNTEDKYMSRAQIHILCVPALGVCVCMDICMYVL